jgi:hypothetical protein
MSLSPKCRMVTIRWSANVASLSGGQRQALGRARRRAIRHPHPRQLTAASIRVEKVVMDALEAFDGGPLLSPSRTSQHRPRRAQSVSRRLLLPKKELTTNLSAATKSTPSFTHSGRLHARHLRTAEVSPQISNEHRFGECFDLLCGNLRNLWMNHRLGLLRQPANHHLRITTMSHCPSLFSP